jgi:hypothetical protein
MKQFITRLVIVPILLICINASFLNGQDRKLVAPFSLNNKFNYELVETHYLPHNRSHIIDSNQEKDGGPLWAGFSLNTEIVPSSEGKVYKWPNDYVSWMLRITSPGAPALGIILENVSIPKNAFFYIYSDENPYYYYKLSAEDIVSGYISTPQIPYSSIIIEYSEKLMAGSESLQGSFTITELVVIYNGLESTLDSKDLNDSDFCEVNINCSPEGDNWQTRKRGVARMLFREGSYWYYCSGTLINNTNQNGIPYFLTADHCGGSASAADRNVWQFYFNYDRPGCANTGVPPTNLITGCVLKSRGNISGGSDFQLVQLNSTPPQAWNPYYNGWDRSTTGATGGVGIHHPSGDAKKISTFTGTLVSSNGLSGMASGSCWRVIWTATTNGHGVTEGGSSGSPIFNNSGLVVGTLSGGSSYCTATSSPDYYGKFSYHWESNGTTDAVRLKPWLDPNNTGVTFLNGFDPYAVTEVDFSANKTVALIDENIVFTDLTNGANISSWSWNFGEGAVPSSASGQGPHTVYYTSIGSKTVSLTVNGNITTTKDNYIFIKEPVETFLLFEQAPSLASGAAVNSTNTGTVNYEVADNFTNLNGTIEKVVVHGVYAYHDGTAWNACTPEQNLAFSIKFYGPNPLQPLWDEPTGEYLASSEVSTYGIWGTWTVYQFDLELPVSEVVEGDGWVSVQSYESQCWFLWFKSLDGDSYAYQENHNGKDNLEVFSSLNNSIKGSVAYDVAMQLWSRVDLSASILSFDFEEDVLVDLTISNVINNEASILATVELGTDLTTLTPVISISEGASIEPTPGVITDFSSPVVYTITSEDSETVNIYTVTVVERDLYTEANILSFNFEEDVVVDVEITEPISGNANISVTVAFGTNITSLTPTMTISTGATIDYSWPTQIDFTNPVEFVVTSEDGINQSTYSVIVIELPQTFTVTFGVQDEGTNALTGAVITLGDITNPANNYIFEGIVQGNYNYSVSLAGYYTLNGSISVVDQDVFVTITLEEVIVTYAVTFNVNMENASNFNPGIDDVYLTGSFTGWAEPGTTGSIEMIPASKSNRTIIFEEGFEGASFPPTGWNKLNPDGGTGFISLANGTTPLPGWEGGEAIAAPNGGTKMAFTSWQQGGAASNDQWLITPSITVEQGSELTFSMRYWPNQYIDNVDVRISTTVNNNPSAFSIVVSEFEFGSASSTDWETYTFTLSDFVTTGTAVYIGFREHVADNYNDGAAIMLDNVIVTRANDGLIYTTTVPLQEGNYEYKHFLNSGWDGGEWWGGENRQVTISSDLVINNVWGILGDSYTVTFIVEDKYGSPLENAVITLGENTNAANNYVFKFVEPGTYGYSVNLNGYQAASGEIAVTNQNITETVLLILVNADINSYSKLQVFPNPFGTQLTIYNAEKFDKVEITNLLGLKVMTIPLHGQSTSIIQTEQLPKGIYLINIVSQSGKQIVKKMIKN